MLTIRLTRVGKKNSPSYRVVVADKKRAVKRKFIEIVGNYNPTLNPKQLVIDKDRANFWMERGAQPSETVNNLMCRLGILPEDRMIKKVYGKKFTKKAIKNGEDKVEEKAPEAKVEEAAEAAETAPEAEVAEEAVAEEAPVVEEAVVEETVVEEAPVAEEAAPEAEGTLKK